MNFQRGRVREDPEINLIPMIDVLLVILIFLMVTTTYDKFSELKISLPQASGEKAPPPPNQISVAVDASERYAINNVETPYIDVDSFAQALRRAAGEEKDPIIIINADARATHQSVINIMEAARIDGYGHLTFTTRK